VCGHENGFLQAVTRSIWGRISKARFKTFEDWPLSYTYILCCLINREAI